MAYEREEVRRTDTLVEFKIKGGDVVYSATLVEWQQYEAEQAILLSGVSKQLIDKLVSAVRANVYEEQRYDED